MYYKKILVLAHFSSNPTFSMFWYIRCSTYHCENFTESKVFSKISDSFIFGPDLDKAPIYGKKKVSLDKLYCLRLNSIQNFTYYVEDTLKKIKLAIFLLQIIPRREKVFKKHLYPISYNGYLKTNSVKKLLLFKPN